MLNVYDFFCPKKFPHSKLLIRYVKNYKNNRHRYFMACKIAVILSWSCFEDALGISKLSFFYRNHWLAKTLLCEIATKLTTKRIDE